jgi:hypothetical protein
MSKKYLQALTLFLLANTAHLCAATLPWQQAATTAKIIAQRSTKIVLYCSPVILSFVFGYLDGKEQAEKDIIVTEKTEEKSLKI